jgi:hypothetical protein
MTLKGLKQKALSAEGTYRTIAVTDLGTYLTNPRSAVALYGQGQGVVTTADGQIAKILLNKHPALYLIRINC